MNAHHRLKEIEYMSKTFLLMLILGLTAGCSTTLQTASNGGSSIDRSSTQVAMPRERVCESADDLLSAHATLSNRTGQYRLTMVADAPDSNRAATRAVSGMLTLRDQIRDPGTPDSPADVSTPLYGFTDIDPRSVGAHRVGDPGSRDPSAPGVLVLEREEYGRRVITLRLGSDANRRDLVRYDGTYTALSVRSIDEEGFAGSWRSGGGLGISVTTGYFCAWKMP